MNIKAIRKRLGLSQVKFAQKIGACEMSIRRWEQGKHQPLPIFQSRIKEVFGIKEGK